LDSIPSDQIASSSDLDTRINILRVDTPRILKRFSMPGAVGSHVWLIYKADAEVPNDWTIFKFIYHAEGSGESSPDIDLPLRVGAYYAIGLLPITTESLLPSPIKGRISFAEVLGSYSPFEQGIGAPGKPNTLLSLILSQPNFGFVQTIGDTTNAYAMELVTTPPCTGAGCIPRPSELGVECDRDLDCISGLCLSPGGTGAAKVCVPPVGDACAASPESCQYDTGNGLLGVCVSSATTSSCEPGCSTGRDCAGLDYCGELFSSHSWDCNTTYLGRACLERCMDGMCPDGFDCSIDDVCVLAGASVNLEASRCSN
jgi:hypothetical protein